jgi:hypothetical protein
MPITEEDARTAPVLATSREPVSPTAKNKADKGTGEQAFNDALIIIGVSWLVLFFLAYSLRSHNI